MRIFIITILLCYSFIGFSQDAELNKASLSIGYFGETVSHPGFQVGLEYYPFSSNRHEIILGVAAGGFVHKRNNTSYFVRIQSGQRIYFKSGLFFEQFLGVGYLRQYVQGGELYEVLPNGAVVEIHKSGDSKFMPSIALGLGYNFKSDALSRFSVFVRPEIFWIAPFNGYYLTSFALNLGVNFKIGKQ